MQFCPRRVIMVRSTVNKNITDRAINGRSAKQSCCARPHREIFANKMGERFKDPANNFMCSFANCKASFSKSWKLEAHYCKHTGLRPFACDSCDKSFCTRSQLTRHNLSHSGLKPHHCLETGCSAAFSSPAGLKNHVERVHLHKNKPYVCDWQGCVKAFSKKTQLKSHTCEHTNQLPFICSYEGCEQKYSTSKKLKKHKNMHNGYPCAEEGCSFQGKTWSEYQAHRKAEHREALPCDCCEKVFYNSWFLKKHKLSVHIGVCRIFKCTMEGCTKTYTKQFNLQSHILSFHEGKCPFICPHSGCGKAFAMEQSLKRHSVVHDPQRKKMQNTEKGKIPKTKVSSPHKISAQLQKLSLNKT